MVNHPNRKKIKRKIGYVDVDGGVLWILDPTYLDYEAREKIKLSFKQKNVHFVEMATGGDGRFGVSICDNHKAEISFPHTGAEKGEIGRVEYLASESKLFLCRSSLLTITMI